MGSLLQILLRALPASSRHDSDAEGDTTEVHVDYYCALCGNVTVEENDSRESKEHHEQRGRLG